ncbi:MAG: cell division protein FtsA [Kiritimatiellae bacterium]|jgi:cell division protein FtsA|nr:cell division protein FtsA [Kiritimatiellia bacterium]
MSAINAALEIGSSRTVLAIGETQQDGRLKVICHSEIPSSGVRKSQVFDLDQVKKSILSVLRESEKKQLEVGSKITLGNAFLVVSGAHVRTTPLCGTTAVARQKVTQEEIDEVRRSLDSFSLPNNREALEVVERGYELDGMDEISDPKGMSGSVLKLHALLVDADANRIQDARTAADGAKLEIRDPLFAATCAADAVLEEYERQNGALVIDCGGGTTGYAVYLNGRLVTAGTIGIGGDHVTNDITHAFQTTWAQAEAIKVTQASAMPTVLPGESARVQMPGDSPLMESRTVSRRALNTVVNARLRELLTILREKLEEVELLHRLHAGAVLVGGGARMREFPALIAQVLGTSARMGRPIHVDGLDDTPDSERFAAIAGALLYAQRTYEEKSFFDLIRRVFR